MMKKSTLLLVLLGIQGGLFAQVKRVGSAPNLPTNKANEGKRPVKSNSMRDVKSQADAADAIKAATAIFAKAEKALGGFPPINAKKVIAALTDLKVSLAHQASSISAKKLSKCVVVGVLSSLRDSYNSFLVTFRKKTTVKDDAKTSMTVAYLSPSRDLNVVLDLLKAIKASLGVFVGLAVADGETFIAPFNAFLDEYKGSSQADSASKYIDNMSTLFEKTKFGSSAAAVIDALKSLNKQIDGLLGRAQQSKIAALGKPGDVDRKAYARYEAVFNDFMDRLDKSTTNAKPSGLFDKLKSKITLAYLKKEDIAAVRELLGVLSNNMKKFMPLLGFPGFEQEGWYVAFADQVANFKTDDRTIVLINDLNSDVLSFEGRIGSRIPIRGIRDEDNLLKGLKSLALELAEKVANKKTEKLVQKAAPAQFILFASLISLIRQIEKEIIISDLSKPQVQKALFQVLNILKAFYNKAYNVKASAAYDKEVTRVGNVITNLRKEEDAHQRADEAKLLKKQTSKLKAAQEKKRLLDGEDITEEHDLTSDEDFGPMVEEVGSDD